MDTSWEGNLKCPRVNCSVKYTFNCCYLFNLLLIYSLGGGRGLMWWCLTLDFASVILVLQYLFNCNLLLPHFFHRVPYNISITTVTLFACLIRHWLRYLGICTRWGYSLRALPKECKRSALTVKLLFNVFSMLVTYFLLCYSVMLLVSTLLSCITLVEIVPTPINVSMYKEYKPKCRNLRWISIYL